MQINNSFPSIHCIKAVDYCFMYFGKIPERFPLNWDTTTKTLQFTGKPTLRKNWLFLIDVFGIVGLLTFVSSLYTLLTTSQKGVIYILVTLIFLIVSAFDVLFALSICIDGEDIVLAFERLKRLCLKLETIQNDPKKESFKWKIISYFVCLSFNGLIALLLGVPGLAAIQNLDPFYNLFQNTIFENTHNRISTAVRFSLLSLHCMQANSLYGLFLTLLFYWMEMQAKCFTILETSKLTDKFFVSCYLEFEVVNKTFNSILSKWISLVLTILFWLISVCVIASIKYNNVIPNSLLWFPLNCAGLDLIVVYLLFPLLTEGFEKTSSILWHRTKGDVRRKGVFMKRKLAVLKPISVNFGSSFRITRETVMSYYNAMIDCVTNGVLL